MNDTMALRRAIRFALVTTEEETRRRQPPRFAYKREAARVRDLSLAPASSKGVARSG